jgi:hypothetical protein
MMKRPRPIVPPADPPPVAPPAPPPQQTRASARYTQAARVRSAVRTQLAHSRRRRQELSHALGILRRDLRQFRSQVRTRLLAISHEAATRRAASARPVTPVNVSSEPVVQPAPPAVPAAAAKHEQR